MAKTRGMTSLEIAVIVAIVLIIAVAVGWYIYTTFVASATGQPRLNIISAEIYENDGIVRLTIVNPGPVDAKIQTIEVGGSAAKGLECEDTQDNVIKVGQQAICKAEGPTGLRPGTMISGRVILSGGQSFPFNAVVRPGSSP